MAVEGSITIVEVNPTVEPKFPHESTEDEIGRARCDRQITRPVRWDESMRQLRLLGTEVIYEIGPGRTLLGLHRRIDREMPVTSISTVEQLKEAFK